MLRTMAVDDDLRRALLQDAPRGPLGDAITRYLAGGAEQLELPAFSPVPSLSTTTAVTVAAVVAGAVGAAVVSRWAARGTVLGTLALGLGAAAAVGLVALLLLVPVGLRPFGVVHLAYLGLVVSVPMIGVAVAVAAIRGDSASSRGLAVAAVLLVLPAALGWYATHVEPYRLTVERVRVPVAADRAGDDPVRIGVLADLQTNDIGRHERRAVDLLLAEEPDLILLPGDLFQGSEGQFAAHEDELRALLGRLEAPHGVYFVRGDVDHRDFADRALRGTGVVILDDQAVEVEVGDRRLRIGGNRLQYAATAAVALRRALEGGTPEDGTVRILVAHRPDAVLDLPPDSRIDLTVAGHTHGGQVVVPGIGPLLTMSRVPRAVAAGGLHAIDGNPIYVSPGVGLERNQAPQIRFLSPPSIAVLELR
jgi:predicted MPP superfamily phosphohydrolase